MNTSYNIYKKLLPLLLRRIELLTLDDINQIKSLYAALNHFELDQILKKEKQKRPYCSLVLATLGLDTDYWKRVHEEFVERNTAAIAIARDVSSDFYKAGGKSLCILENFGTLLSGSMSVGCFGSGDIDFTVNRDEAELAIKVFNDNGFFVTERQGQTFAPDRLESQFYNKEAINGKGFWINILWKPIIRNYMVVQEKYSKRLELFRTTRTVRYKDTQIRLLDPTAMVYFNALHQGSEHHYTASPDMALCCDIDRVVGSNKINWEEIVQWSKEDNAGIRVQMTLDICHYFLKTEVPEDLFGEKSIWYKLLWKRLVDEKNYQMISQDGKIARLVAELLSDNMPITLALISRLWRK